MPAGRASGWIAGMRIRTVVAVLAALLVLPAAATAAKRPQLPVLRNFVLQSAVVTAEADWHWQSSVRTDRCTNYEIGSGDQLIVYRLPRAARYQLIQVGKSASISPREAVRFEGTVSRRYDWRPHASECGICGGELGECDGSERQPQGDRPPRFDCGQRDLRVAQMHVVLMPKSSPHNAEDKDYVSVEPKANEPEYRNCPPTQEGGPDFPSDLFGAIPIMGPEYQRLLRAKPGQTVTLSGSAKHGDVQRLDRQDSGIGYQLRCPSLSGPGRQICVKQTVRAVFKRVR